jgi:hypothetical protein
MLSFDHKSYIPIAMEYDVVPYNNELVKLQGQRLSKKTLPCKAAYRWEVTKKEAT